MATLVIMIHVESIKLHSGLRILVEFEDFVTLRCIGDTEVLYVESLTLLVTLMFMHGKSHRNHQNKRNSAGLCLNSPSGY